VMEYYYLSFKEKRPFTEEARFVVDFFKADFSDIDRKFQIRDWEPFTVPLDLLLRRDKDGPAFKRPKLTSGLSDPFPSMMSGDASIPPIADRHVSSPASGLLKMAQVAHSHNAQLLKLAKTIPPMIQQAIKKAMKPMVDKLGSLCAGVDVLEGE
ncbi:hypothetical protein HAX54_049307, partial [Datura stramonium]|nr:hypothetical protein [Datura stramonium]